MKIGLLAFIAGVVLAVIAAVVDTTTFWWLPWLVGGVGIVFGYLVRDGSGALLALLGLTGALFVIQQQPYNPHWLTEIVFYARVFVSHALLLVGLLAVLKIART